MCALGRKVLPPGFDEGLMSCLAPTGLYPDQAALVFGEMSEHTPWLLECGVRPSLCLEHGLLAYKCTQIRETECAWREGQFNHVRGGWQARVHAPFA
jgi:hypothetical protein